MEAKDLELIQKHLGDNVELRRLWEEHLALEQRIQELERRHPQSDEIHFEIETIKKQKLRGKDHIATILTQYR